MLTGAIGVLTRPPNSSHSVAVLVRKMARSSACSSRLPRAWSAYLEPGQRSKRSARSSASQKFFQKACSEAMKRTCWPSLGLVDLIAHPFDHAGRARGPAFVVVGLVARDLGFGALVGTPSSRSGTSPWPRRRRTGPGRCRSPRRCPGPDDRGQNAERPEEGAGVDADGDVLGDVGEALVVGRHVDDAGPGVVGHAVARVVPVGAGHAVARDGAEHDLGVDGPQLLVTHAAAGQRARTHGLDHHVGTGGQLLQDGRPRPRCADRAPASACPGSHAGASARCPRRWARSSRGCSRPQAARS